MAIHTFGDSHCDNPWACVPNIQRHFVGPKLCFSVGRDGIIINNGYNVKNGDTVIFCFGEIDCRCHIQKHIRSENDYKQIIDNIVYNYFVQIKNAIYTFDNLKTCIYNVVPPIEKHTNSIQDAYFPQLGTDEERKTYVLYFNEKLKEKCMEYGFIYFDVYDKYTDSNGFLNKSLSDGSVHIRDGIHMKEFIETNDL